jgi:hypothetical protein
VGFQTVEGAEEGGYGFGVGFLRAGGLLVCVVLCYIKGRDVRSKS